MSVIFDCIYKIFCCSATTRIFYDLSLALFICLLTLGCVCIVILHCIKSSQKRSMRWLFYVFQGGYILDICIATCEYEMVGLYYSSITSDFLSCTARFTFLLIVYALVCAYKKLLLWRENNYEDEKGNFLNNSCNNNAELTTNENLNLINYLDESNNELVDVNLSFVNKLTNALLDKELNDSEKEFCLDLLFDLKSLPTKCEIERVKSLNAKLRTLTKKASEYNIAC